MRPVASKTRRLELLALGRDAHVADAEVVQRDGEGLAEAAAAAGDDGAVDDGGTLGPALERASGWAGRGSSRTACRSGWRRRTGSGRSSSSAFLWSARVLGVWCRPTVRRRAGTALPASRRECNEWCNSPSIFRDLPLTRFAFTPRGGRMGRAIRPTGADHQMQPKTRRVAVLGGNRIPFARSNTVYATASNQDMLTAAIDGLVARFGLEGERLGEVVAGAVLKHSRDFNLTRESVLGSKLAPETPATDLQQACGTGLQAAIYVANKIALGPDRRRHRGWLGHHLRRPDRDLGEAAQEADQGQPAEGHRRASSRRSARSARPTSASRSRRTASPAPGCRWASTPP